MDDMIKKQPASSDASDDEQTFFSQMMKILKDNGPQFLRGTGMTLLISMTGTIAGLIIGLLIGVFRTAPMSKTRLSLPCKHSLVGSSMSTLKSSAELR